MEYKSYKRPMDYLNSVYDRMSKGIFRFLFPDSGLELVIAGVPNKLYKALDVNREYGLGIARKPVADKFRDYLFASNNNNVGTYSCTSDGKIKVTRTDGKEVYLNGESARNTLADYIKKVLKDNGMPAGTSLAKRIARELRESMIKAGKRVNVPLY